MKRIVWIASYPKSGNTWFRIFLTNFLRDGDAPADINDLAGGPIASARDWFDEAVGYDSGELTFDEIDALRPDVYRYRARTAAETLYLKVHDAYTFLPDGRPLFPPEATCAAIYLVRNPLDVVASYAHHVGGNRLDATIRDLADPRMELAAFNATEDNQLRQKLLTWSDHTASWADAAGFPVHVIRYEDLLREPIRTFGDAVRFLGLPDDPARVGKAAHFSRFEEVRRQEQANGFREKLPRSPSFFRKGQAGAWRDELSPEQVERVLSSQQAALRRFGYLDEAGRPAF